MQLKLVTQIRSLGSSRQLLRLALALPLIASLSSCGQVDLSSKNADLSQQKVTESSKPIAEYPDDTPSSADGKIVWETTSFDYNGSKTTCVACHGDGTGGSAGINFSDKAVMDNKKPVDQYMFLTWGRKTDDKGNVTEVQHPKMYEQLTKRQRWNLVFYLRSLSRPIVASVMPDGTPNADYLPIDAVFGANCVVCHGKKGNGDGPLAHNLEPVPANFANFERFYDRTDAVLWDHIANGIPWEGMPNFKNHGEPKHDKAKNVTFDDAYIWKLVQYVRHFQSVNTPTLKVASNNPQENEAQKSTSAPPAANSGQNTK